VVDVPRAPTLAQMHAAAPACLRCRALRAARGGDASWYSWRVPVLSPLSREISAKIVYYGPGLSGKTTTLQAIHNAVRPERRGDLVSLSTETDRTIFFDFLPVRIERVRGLSVRFQLYTVPGQVFYAATRKLVLNGADGVVFVADSQPISRDANLESFEGLRANLTDLGVSLASFPLVFQYNKQDLEDALGEEEMAAMLNPMGAPQFCTSATKGTGVIKALKEITRRVTQSLHDSAPKSGSKEAHAPVLPSKRDPSARWFEDVYSEDSIAGRVVSIARQSLDSPVAEPAPEDASTVRPPSPSFSFAGLWPEDGGDDVRDVERQVAAGEHATAVHIAAHALAELLGALPGPDTDDGPAAKASLLGLDGREYLRLCRLATVPREALTARDALFALYMLVAARIKSESLPT